MKVITEAEKVNCPVCNKEWRLFWEKEKVRKNLISEEGCSKRRIPNLAEWAGIVECINCGNYIDLELDGSAMPKAARWRKENEAKSENKA